MASNPIVHAEKRSLVAAMAARFQMEPEAFFKTIKATVMPSATATNEQIAAFLAVAHSYQLNPFTREIYAFPTKSGGIQPVVSVDGWIRLINEQPNLDGIDFIYEEDSDGKLLSVTCLIFRKDRSRPTVIKEFMSECARSTDPWRQWPRRMLRHKALIQGARVAFGFSGIMEQDEAERADDVIVRHFEDVPLPTTPADQLRAAVAKKAEPEPPPAEPYHDIVAEPEPVEPETVLGSPVPPPEKSNRKSKKAMTITIEDPEIAAAISESPSPGRSELIQKVEEAIDVALDLLSTLEKPNPWEHLSGIIRRNTGVILTEGSDIEDCPHDKLPKILELVLQWTQHWGDLIASQNKRP